MCIDFPFFCPSPVNDYPHEKYLNRHVRDKVCAAGPDVWRDLGVELMEEKDVYALNTIQADNPDNVKCCCTKMFTEWRNRSPKANWKQLIEALKEINLTQLASELEGLLRSSVECSGEESTYVDVDASQGISNKPEIS